MNNDLLIQFVEDRLNLNTNGLVFKIYDALKMDNSTLDVDKINGIARIGAGSPDPIAGLGQSTMTMSIEFIYPYERFERVKEILIATANSAAGLVINNSTLGETLTGTTGVAITYPVQGNYNNGTMGETVKSRLVCYFDINEKAVLANNVKVSIVEYYDAQKDLTGTYYTFDGTTYTAVQLPAGYTEGVIYYTLSGENYVQASSTFTTTATVKYYVYDTQYTEVTLPSGWVAGKFYYKTKTENVPYYKFVVTRHRQSTTNKFANNKEMQTINDGQSIDFSFAIPSISGSVINRIKDDMLLGENTQKPYDLIFTDESGAKTFRQVIASGDFSYENVPDDTVILKMLFVYKRV